MFYNHVLKKNLSLHPLINDAKNALDNDVILHYRTFNQTWANTAVIWSAPGVLAGQAFTTKKVSVFYGKHGSVAVYVDRDLAYVILSPTERFKDDVHACNMEYAHLAKDVYEKPLHSIHMTYGEIDK